MQLKHAQMLFCAVAFVLLEAVVGIEGVVVGHDLVARLLGNHGGGSDADREGVTTDNAFCWRWKSWGVWPIDQDVVGLDGETSDGDEHRFKSRFENVDLVDDG